MKNYFRQLLFESFLATVLVFFVVWVFFILLTLSFKPINFLSKSLKSIDLTDLYMGQVKTPKSDPQICVVNISDLDRCRQAELIETIARAQPKVIGLDILYASDPAVISQEDTSCTFTQGKQLLANTFSRYPEIIVQAMAYTPGDMVANDKYLSFNEITAGDVNTLLTSEDQTTPVRKYIPFKVSGSDTLFSFSYEILRKAYPSMFQKAIVRNRPNEIINYTGNLSEFNPLEGEEILDGENFNPGILKDRIVLLGFTGKDSYGSRLDDFDDLYFSPLNPKLFGKTRPDMYGVVIHANVISMARNGTFIDRKSGWGFGIFVFLITWMHVLPFIHYFVRKRLWFHIFTKGTQLVSLVLITWLVFWLLEEFQISINIKYLFIAVFVSVDVLHLYAFFAVLVYKKWNIRSLFIKDN